MAETKQLYVSGLPFDASEEEIKADFSKYGVVHEVAIITHKDSGKPKGFAFITVDAADERTFLDLDGAEYGKRFLTIREKKQRPVIERSGVSDKA